MANRQHLETLKQGVHVWNRWRAENLDIVPDLGGADLHGMDLDGANLGYANLVEANLTWGNLNMVDLNNADLRDAMLDLANLGGADLGGSNLSGAKLVNANLSFADLAGADLKRTDLTGADLTGVNFNNADLNSADLTNVDFGLTVLGNVDLRFTKGLESITHHGPSTIGIDTLYISQGKVPEIFLRGAGVPDNFIEYISSLVGKAIEYYSCFISYSSPDQEFVDRLHADLQDKGVRCWYAPEDLKGGKKLYEQLAEAIRYHDKLLLVLSQNSMASKWVETEIKKAKEREEREGRQIMFPIGLTDFERLKEWELFDSDHGTDLAAYVRSFFIPEFVHWRDHDRYKAAFDRLLRDLQASDGRTRSV